MLCVLLVSAGFWLLRGANSPKCSDCFRPYGFPFRYYHEGGFAGGAGWVKENVAKELAAIILVSLVLTWAWSAFVARRRSA